MNLFDYLKWRYEEGQRKAKANATSKFSEEIAELTGEIAGLEESLKILKYANQSLVCSNYHEQVETVQELTKKIARRTYLQEKSKGTIS